MTNGTDMNRNGNQHFNMQASRWMGEGLIPGKPLIYIAIRTAHGQTVSEISLPVSNCNAVTNANGNVSFKDHDGKHLNILSVVKTCIEQLQQKEREEQGG